MGSALPTLLVVGVMALEGFVLINPELRCSVMNLCGTTPRGAAPEEEEEEPEDPAVPPVVNVYNPAPIITPPPVIVRPQYYPQTQSAVHDCCDCRMINGRAKCRAHGGGYDISYSSARYDVREAARLCAKNKCYQPRPQPQPPSCRTQITKHGRTYYITNLKNLPAVMTMQFPPTYVKEGNCVYQLIQSSPAPAPNTPAPTPGPKTTDCDNYLCKSYPWLCPKCVKANYAASFYGTKSLFGTTRIAY
jgi:hypothetical protein